MLVPSVSRISIAPVKGLGLVHPEEVELGTSGVLENRRFQLVDADGRRYNQIRRGELVRVQPTYDAERETLALRFPDGATVEGGIELGEALTVDFYGRPVEGRVVEGPWAAALSRYFETPLLLLQSAPGAAVDRRRGHVSLVSEASLEELARQAGVAEPVDGRRFRMLFQLGGCRPHEEDEWLGGDVQIGAAVVRLRGTVGRCAITTQNPDSGVPDLDTLYVLQRYRGLNENRELDFGVYGEVLQPGRVRVGDSVAAA